MLFSPQRKSNPEDIERAERLREVFSALNEANKIYPIIVEGKKDVIALKKLGLEGEIITLHSGRNLYEFCEDISERYSGVILLLDWDTKGEILYKSLCKHLNGYWEEFAAFRGVIKILCQKDIKDIESVPKLLSRLEGHEYPG